MSVSIDIIPSSDFLDVYGEPDPSSAYSLSGHVSISVTSPYSMFERRRTARLLLQSILLTFEGQTEIITPQTGYSSLRLCSITQEIAPSDPVELNNEGHEDSSDPCVWNVIFNLPIPGWLPESTTYGIEDVGIRYGLFAVAKFINLDDNQSGTWSFATLCAPFRSQVKSVDAQKQITLRRLMSEPDDLLESRTTTFIVNSPVAVRAADASRQIPTDVLSKIQVLASVPHRTDIRDESFPLTIRMRTMDLDASECRRIQLSSISADIVQSERVRSRPYSEYLRRYPVPSPSRQPPNVPLKDPHPVSSMYDMGLYSFGAIEGSASRSFSLLPPGESGLHALEENNYPFANDADSGNAPTWYTLETNVPFVSLASGNKGDNWAGTSALRRSLTSPLIHIKHEVTIEVTCMYEFPDSDEQATERLSFSVPVHFTRIAPPNPQPQRDFIPPPLSPSLHLSMAAPSLPPLMSYVQNLPAYSQLFDRNGDRKIDYSIPLPLYSPHSFSFPSSAPVYGNDVEQKEHEPLFSPETHS